jgi:predicted enzyme related to lactoylglutathione lyase
MSPASVVHLELHTHDMEAASAFYSELLRWPTERIDSSWGTYHPLLLGADLDGGIVECGTRLDDLAAEAA